MNQVKLLPWKLKFKPGWDKHLKKFDKPIQEKILKKLEKMKQPLKSRGLRSSKYRGEEIGQYRIAFIQDKKTRTKKIHFVGNHKQYEKWYKNQ